MGLDRIPRLYAILDAGSCARRALDLMAVAGTWHDAGVRLLQYRDKTGTDDTVVRNAKALRSLFGSSATLILNDRVSLFAATGFDGLHVGQGDGSVASVRAAIGPDALLGVSTHNAAEVTTAELENASYVAVGPVFSTSTKLDAESVVGLEGVRLARSLTAKPLVAIGGITAESAPDVFHAGADSVAVISALLDGDLHRLLAR